MLVLSQAWDISSWAEGTEPISVHGPFCPRIVALCMDPGGEGWGPDQCLCCTHVLPRGCHRCLACGHPLGVSQILFGSGVPCPISLTLCKFLGFSSSVLVREAHRCAWPGQPWGSWLLLVYTVRSRGPGTVITQQVPTIFIFGTHNSHIASENRMKTLRHRPPVPYPGCGGNGVV